MDVTGFPRREFTRLAQHIRALAAVHDILTRPVSDGCLTSLETVPVRLVFDKILPMLEQAIGAGRLSYTLDDANLPIRQISSLSLVINELLSNAVKHGCGTVEVAFAVREDVAILTVSDSGPGFPAGFDPITAANTGLELVKNLVAWDLQGQACFSNIAIGAQVTITLPLSFLREVRRNR